FLDSSIKRYSSDQNGSSRLKITTSTNVPQQSDYKLPDHAGNEASNSDNEEELNHLSIDSPSASS
ncbi:unnamed protein product, partial [Rotaria sordida]